METKQYNLSITFDANKIDSQNPDDLKLVISVPDEFWDEIIDGKIKLITIMEDALIAAIRGSAEVGGSLHFWIDKTCRRMKERVSKGDNSLVKIVPESWLDTKNTLSH